MVKLRVNTRSPESAVYTKYYLERKYGMKYAYAISSRNIIMFDFDGIEEESLKEAKTIAAMLVMMWGKYAKIYRSPNGYHLIYYRPVSWKAVRRFIAFLRLKVEEGEFKHLDAKYLEAVLRRGYMTLRLNQLEEVCVVDRRLVAQSESPSQEG